MSTTKALKSPQFRPIDAHIQSEFQKAFALHQRGNLTDAEVYYKYILRHRPNHFDALHLLGLVNAQRENTLEAEKFFRKALHVNPNSASALSNLGIVLSDMKKFDESLASFDRAISINPRHFDAFLNRGNILKDRKHYVDALSSYNSAIQINDGRADAYFNRANLFKEIKKLDEARADYTIALCINPRSSEAYTNRGLVLKEASQLEAALADFNSAINLRPNQLDLYYNRGNILIEMDRSEEAIDDYTKYFSQEKSDPYEYFKFGQILYQLERFVEALENFNKAIEFRHDFTEALSYRALTLTKLDRSIEALKDHTKAIHLKGDSAELYSNYGVTLQQMQRLDDAITNFEKAVMLDPYLASAHYNCGNAYRDLARYTEAIACFEAATTINPHFGVAHVNHSLCLLSQSNFNDGWDKYEWRLKTKNFKDNALKGHCDLDVVFSVRNDREHLIGKTVFVASEQGVGDYIMFLSILPDLCKDAKKIICQLDRRMIGIFSRVFPEVTFIRTGDMQILESATIDRFVRMGSLAYTYRRSLNNFSGKPYLTADPARVTKWQTRMNSGQKKMKVGISWRGGTDKTNSKDRSMILEQLTPLLDRDDCTFVSLQYGEVEREVTEFNARRNKQLFCFPKSELNDFEDFAGLIGALDCIVTVQNTTVHMCGALGKTCFTMLPFIAQWRYGSSGTKMPWYDSVALHRQSEDRRWDHVISNISQELDEFLKCAVLPERPSTTPNASKSS